MQRLFVFFTALALGSCKTSSTSSLQDDTYAVEGEGQGSSFFKNFSDKKWLTINVDENMTDKQGLILAKVILQDKTQSLNQNLSFLERLEKLIEGKTIREIEITFKNEAKIHR